MNSKRGNKSDFSPELMAELLGYHLGMADADGRRQVEAAFADSRSLADARQAVQRFLAPLEQEEAPAIPANLVVSIMQRVDVTTRTIPFARAAAMSPATERGGSGPLFSLREVMGLAAAILIFVGIFVPGYRSARMAAQQVACSNNMRQIGRGYVDYANLNDNQLPFMGAGSSGSMWTRSEQIGAPRVNNSQANFQLVRNRFVPPAAFVCPARPGDTPVAAEHLEDLVDFPDVRNNSYATTLSDHQRKGDSFDLDMPFSADQTPLVDDSRRLIVGRPIPENSNSHGPGRGQNVLRGDMSVIWTTTPRVGPDNDDIYRLIGVQQYTGSERPSLRTDAFLVP